VKLRALIVSSILLSSVIARAQNAELAAEVEVRVVKTAESELGKLERALRSTPGITADVIANVTLPLQSAIEEDLGRGPVKIYPRAMFDTCVGLVKKGQSKDVIGRTLVSMHRKGDFAHANPAPSGGDANVKKVASFVFDKERLHSPDPHLPPSIKPAPGEKLKGVYQICVGTDGKVTKVTTVQSISGADQAVMEQIQSTWVYKPQPVPVCTVRAFIFQFN
jgi:hypothetical protein